MYINYEYYRVFYYAAKCGNLTKAAALLQNWRRGSGIRLVI